MSKFKLVPVVPEPIKYTASYSKEEVITALLNYSKLQGAYVPKFDIAEFFSDSSSGLSLALITYNVKGAATSL